MRFLIIILIMFVSNLSYAKTYSANIPAWRGEWIWGPRKNNVPVMTVNLREWLSAKPGGWGQSLINRTLGNGAIAGIGEVRWRLDDGRGNALFPYENKKRVLNWPNWGVDFSSFDFPVAAAKFAKRCGMNIIFVADKQFLNSAKKRYPQLDVQLSSPVSSKTISVIKLNPAKGAVRWTDHRTFEFKREFTISKKINKARLCITADAVYRIYIDNKAIGSDGDWWRGETYDVSSLLTPGKHIIKALVKPSKKYSGLLLNLEWTTNNGSLKQVNTGADWLCRAVGTKKWLPVSITGYEGTGPRFRLKDPWLNPRSLICNLKSTEKFVDATDITVTASSNAKTALKSIDGSLSTFWAGKGAGAELNLILEKPVLLTEIRIFSGNPSYHGLPSGACPLKAYKIQYFENGTWRNLIEPVKNASDNNDRLCHSFTPRRIKKLRIVIDKTYDTLKRNTGTVSAAKMSGIIREIKLIKAHGAK